MPPLRLKPSTMARNCRLRGQPVPPRGDARKNFFVEIWAECEQPLHDAMLWDKYEKVDLLLNAVAEEPVNAVDSTGLSVLHIACARNNVKVAKQLLKSGVDVNGCVNSEAKRWPGYAALHFAAEKGHADLVVLLLRQGADANAREAVEQSTPLHLAMRHQHLRVIEALLENGADANATDRKGRNILHIMADFNPKALNPQFIESYDMIMATVIDHGCDINAQGLKFCTPLLPATFWNNSAPVRSLLRHFSDINIMSKYDAPMESFELLCINDDLYYIFYRHIMMIKLIGLPVRSSHEKAMNVAASNVPSRTAEQLAIQSADYLSQCRGEIERMKGVTINSNTTLYDIIFKKPWEMAKLAGNRVLARLFSSAAFEEDYKIYRKLLESQFKKGLALKMLMSDAKLSLEGLIGVRLPDACLENILKFISVEGLKDLIRARTTSSYKAECVTWEKAIAYCKCLTETYTELDE